MNINKAMHFNKSFNLSILKNLFDNQNQAKRDHQYILSGSIVTFFLIFSMSIYRFINSEYTAALVDLVIAISLLVFSFIMYMPVRLKYLNVFVVGFCFIATMSFLYFKGADGLFWVFPLISAIFFMLKKSFALIVSTITIILTLPLVVETIDIKSFLEIYPSLVLVSIFQFFWASRADRQQYKLFEMATNDTLTKVKNRRSFNLKVDETLLNSNGARQVVSLIIFDLDNFKKINDKFGHIQGDNILVHFASLIKSNLRKSDFIFRYGGEEFIVIANNSNLNDTVNLAEFLRKKVENDNFLKGFNLTVSIGVSEFDVDFDNSTSWINRADNALYAAKEAGRNSVYIAQQSEDDENEATFISFKNYAKQRT